jgi:hypothetical protein
MLLVVRAGKPAAPTAIAAAGGGLPTTSGRSARQTILELGPDKYANYDCEQAKTFNQSGGDNHSRLDFARSIGLTADSIHGAAANATNTQAYAQSNQTCTDTGTHYSQTRTVVGSHFSSSLQQQRKKHKKKKKGEEKKLANPAAGRGGMLRSD